MHIELDPNVRPVHAQVRQVPVAKLGRVNEELERLSNEGIITPVTQTTDWFSNILVKEKPNGKLRICIDPSQTINKAVRLFSIHSYLVTKDDKDVFYTLSKILLISALKIKQSLIQVEA